MHSYKTGGNLNARDMTDEEALEYAVAHNIGAGNAVDAQLTTEAAHQDIDAEGEAEVEEEEEEPEKEPTPPPVVKATPKAKSSRKSKGKAVEPEVIIPPAAPATIVPPKPEEKAPTPAAKRKRAGKKEEPAEKEEPAVETPKSTSKPRKKKSKADN